MNRTPFSKIFPSPGQLRKKKMPSPFFLDLAYTLYKLATVATILVIIASLYTMLIVGEWALYGCR